MDRSRKTLPEIETLLLNQAELKNRQDEPDVLDTLLMRVVQYVSNTNSPYDGALPHTEAECVQKIMTKLNLKSDTTSGELLGDIFFDRYNSLIKGIEKHGLRDFLANLILCQLEEDVTFASKLNASINASTLKNATNGKQSNWSASPLNISVLGESQEERDATTDIVQNAIYCLMGVPGKYLRKDVITGRFKLDPTNGRSLTGLQAGMLMRLSELGFYHDRLDKYSNMMTGYTAIGSMGQAFITKLKKELNMYNGQVALLQDKMTKYKQQLRDFSQPEDQWMEHRAKAPTLLGLICWYIKPLHRLQYLVKVAHACQLKKGGELATAIFEQLNTGDPVIDELGREVLIACCAPLVRMISKWMLEGGIDDNYGEFFVESLSQVGADRLWHDKFRLRLSMLPKFLSRELADKILRAGKSINFLREVCETHEPINGLKELKQVIENNIPCIFACVPDTSWHAAIETAYMQASKDVLDVMVGPHKLLVHLKGMRRYLLLGQGDFVTIFIEMVKDELEKLGTEVLSHDLSVMLDAAVRSINSQHEDLEILNHLDVVVKTPYAGDTGWDVISLQYIVRGPLATMLEPAMPTYKELFKPLWRIKHMEFVLSSKIWKEQMCNAKALRALKNEISQTCYRLHLFTSEIMHFVHQMQYYVLFEVIECQWVELQKHMEQATALDDILDAHSRFLAKISVGCFVNSSSTMERHLEKVYDSIIWLENWQCNFYDSCYKELEARQRMKRIIAESEITGHFGMTTEQKMERDQECKLFEQSVVSANCVLEVFATSYGKSVATFLLALNSSTDPNLQLLGTRLDFNEYYKKRDTNLSKPLTFEHMRMSNVLGKNNNAGRYSLFTGNCGNS
ncbi:l-1-dd4 [Drosophila busckii]|uniref:L-1-dd4 n=1 Tax=Drosophila busckii TaxID=30019 RepID=A0A0M4ELT8_DROBS|nr:gamma-tubulin complex component 3 [Drosophila busckii]XP_017853116.1 gamma-tubulin complex component 3 [Drosophila busckii]ALC48521.1 l-1-dd4 [Drosophila busckii]